MLYVGNELYEDNRGKAGTVLFEDIVFWLDIVLEEDNMFRGCMIDVL